MANWDGYGNAMAALSIWTYYRNNKRKVLPITGIIALAIVSIASSGTLTGSLYQDEEQEIALYDHYALVFSSLRSGLSEQILGQVEGHATVAEAVRLERRTTPRQGLFGRPGTPIFFLSELDQRPFASRLGWDLLEGRWPESGTNEVAITENLLRNRGLRVGDRIGQAVDDEDFLIGEWQIVGAFGAAEVIGGLGSLVYLREHFLAVPGAPDSLVDQTNLLAVAPVAGQETELEALLDSLPKDELFVIHRSLARRNFESFTTNIDMIIWILNGMSIAVLTMALGLLNIIFFMQRANEFGLLAALGYTKRTLMRRVFLESTTTVVVAWGLGILLSVGIYSILNSLIFVPRGLETFSVLTPRVLLFTAPIPVTVTLFSVAIVMWQLQRMDPVAIIERRD